MLQCCTYDLSRTAAWIIFTEMHPDGFIDIQKALFTS